jgi:tyrosine-protein phosphatase SIW14
MYICDDEYTMHNQDFLKKEGIQFYQFPISGNKEPFVEIDQKEISEALSILVDERNHPSNRF